MPENSGTGEVGPRWYGQDPSPYYSTGLGGSTGDPNRPGSSLGSVDIAANPYESSQVARRDAHIDTGATAQMGQYPAAEPLSGVDLDGTGAGQGQPVSPPHPNSNGPGRM